MNAPVKFGTFVSDAFVEHPGLLKLHERARKVAKRNAKAFLPSLRQAYWRGFVEGCTGLVLDDGDFTLDQHVAYVCGGIDGSAWA